MKYRILLVALLALAGCGSAGPTNKGVYLLLDTSGTYSGELKKAEHIILFMLSRLEPTDSFAVARIDTGSFSEADIIAKATFDDRPSTANRQKRVFAGQVKSFVERSDASPYTDITGGLLQAIEFLNEKGSGRKEILIFSDLKEDLAKGYVREVPLSLEVSRSWHSTSPNCARTTTIRANTWLAWKPGATRSRTAAGAGA
jgi:hypothetical protein